MPTAIAITLPWGRYHATPWGRHVNEGAIDWPPSPWRLLRALYATWKTRCPELDDDRVLTVLGRLLDPPTYELPEFADAHTRHYMPDHRYLDGVSETTDKVIDAFAVVERSARMVVRWPVDLTSDERAVLATIARRVPYLGRADSPCEMTLLDGDDERHASQICSPRAFADASTKGDTVRLLVLEPPLREELLTVRTTDVRRARLRLPRGTSWVDYDKPVPTTSPAVQTRQDGSSAAVEAVRWAIVTNARPSVYATVAMTDVLRRAAMGTFGKRHDEQPSACLSGKDATGRKLHGHRHAHYLALDSNGDGLIDHLVAWAPGGFSREEVAALARIPALRGFAHVEDFRPCELGLEGVGPLNAVAPQLVGSSRHWRSVTPFAPGHHGRKRVPWPEHVAAQVRAELDVRGLPAPIDVRVLAGPALAFRRHRPTKERLRDARRAVFVEMEFATPVTGPIALGALCHFGLGLFEPEPR